jgi:hypothetical protein
MTTVRLKQRRTRGLCAGVLVLAGACGDASDEADRKDASMDAAMSDAGARDAAALDAARGDANGANGTADSAVTSDASSDAAGSDASDAADGGQDSGPDISGLNPGGDSAGRRGGERACHGRFPLRERRGRDGVHLPSRPLRPLRLALLLTKRAPMQPSKPAWDPWWASVQAASRPHAPRACAAPFPRRARVSHAPKSVCATRPTASPIRAATTHTAEPTLGPRQARVSRASRKASHAACRPEATPTSIPAQRGCFVRRTKRPTKPVFQSSPRAPPAPPTCGSEPRGKPARRGSPAQTQPSVATPHAWP